VIVRAFRGWFKGSWGGTGGSGLGMVVVEEEVVVEWCCGVHMLC